MKRIIILSLILTITSIIFRCKSISKCDNLRKGTFQIYENNELIGNIYRINNYQFEEYLDSKKINIIKFRKENCSFFINAIQVKEAFDTITWKFNYQSIDENNYTLEAQAAYIKLDYLYKGSIKKISNNINNLTVLYKYDSIWKIDKLGQINNHLKKK